MIDTEIHLFFVIVAIGATVLSVCVGLFYLWKWNCKRALRKRIALAQERIDRRLSAETVQANRVMDEWQEANPVDSGKWFKQNEV